MAARNFKEALNEITKNLFNDYDRLTINLMEASPYPVSPSVLKSLNKEEYVTQYVQEKIEQWQKKGEFEKISEYEKRVTDQSRNLKAEEFAQEGLAKLGQNIKLDNLKLGEYDAENETYLVRSDYFKDIVVPVSIDNAEEFKNHWDQLKFRNPRYDLDDNELTLSEVTFHDPVSDTSYDYNRRQSSTYAINQIDYNFDDINYDAPEEKQETQEKIVEKDISLGQSDIAQQIPETSAKNPNAIAVIIGNKDYKHTKDVKYALNDAQTMKQYLVKTLGYKPGNVFYLENATKSNFETYFGTKVNPRGILYNQLKKNQSEVFVYYAGHGAPDLDDHKAYFVPVDCDPNYLEQGGYPRELFYSNISKLPAKNVTVVIDACFSGSEVYEDMSPVMPKVTDPMEKM
ncbi:MAG: caspase family protein, partial [Bacteroidota bacterium]